MEDAGFDPGTAGSAVWRTTNEPPLLNVSLVAGDPVVHPLLHAVQAVQGLPGTQQDIQGETLKELLYRH